MLSYKSKNRKKQRLNKSHQYLSVVIPLILKKFVWQCFSHFQPINSKLWVQLPRGDKPRDETPGLRSDSQSVTHRNSFGQFLSPNSLRNLVSWFCFICTMELRLLSLLSLLLVGECKSNETTQVNSQHQVLLVRPERVQRGSVLGKLTRTCV